MRVTGSRGLSTMPGMRFRSIAWAGALWLITQPFAASSPADKATIDGRLQQADKLQDDGALADALGIYQSVLNTLPIDPPTRQLGHALNGLSNVSSSLGDYKQAIELANRAEDAYRRLGDADGQAYALNNRGIAEVETGQYPAAQASLRQALVFSQQAADVETQVRTLNNLGNAYYFPGQYLESMHAYQEAWNILQSHIEQKWNDYWRQITRFNQATLYQRLGRYQSALEIYREVEKSKGLSPSDRAHLLTNLGVLYRRMGDAWKALDAYRAALHLYARQSDSGGEISTLKNIGIVNALDVADLGKARVFFEQALARAQQTDNQREVMQAHLYLGEAKLREGKLDESRDELQEALNRAQKLGTMEEQWKALYGLGRLQQKWGRGDRAEKDYREAVEIIEKSRTQLQLSALRAEFLADKRDVYDALIALLLKKDDLKETFLFLERSRARTFQDRLTTSTSENPNTPSRAIGLDEAQTYLDPQTALLEFWVAGDQLGLLWCTHDLQGLGQVQFASGERERILGLLRRMPDNFSGDWRRETAILARLIPNAVSLPTGVRHLVIVQDGWLSSVPFDLVPVNEDSGALLIERFDISYLPTAALLRRPSIERRIHFPWTIELTAFGKPETATGADALQNFQEVTRLRPLPFSEEEIRGIAGIASGRARIFLGSGNTKTTFQNSQTRGPIVHVSTHAFADAEVPENSRILFSLEPSGVGNYLFLRELYDMDLRGVNLAALSACDTERGRMIRGEGVQAFSRALLVAGSRSSLTTLWRVADQPTGEFMLQFYYFALQKHQSKAEALRAAKLKFLHSQTEIGNPAHWAAFVITGDGTNPLPRFFSWAELISIALVAVAIAGSGIWLLLRIRRRVDGINRSQNVVS